MLQCSIIRGVGYRPENPREATYDMMDTAGDAASKATDTMNSAASGICLC
jgi:hypothetical protein